MGQWITDPETGMQKWQGSLLPQDQWKSNYIESEFGNSWGPASPTYDTAQFPGGGTNADYPIGAQIGVYGDPNGGTWQQLKDGNWYYRSPDSNQEISGGGSVPVNGSWDLSKRMTQDQMQGYAQKNGQPLQMLENPAPQSSAWDSPFMGAGLFLGGLGAIGALPGIAGSMGDWASGLFDGFGGAAQSSGASYIDALGDAVGGDAAGAWTGSYPTFNTGYVDAIGDTVGGEAAGKATTAPWWEKLYNGVSNSKDALSALSKGLSAFGTTPTIDTGSAPSMNYGQANAVNSTPQLPQTLDNPSFQQTPLGQMSQPDTHIGYIDPTPANDTFMRSGATWNQRMAHALKAQ